MLLRSHKRLGQFSKGMLQRIGLAQALIGDPDLVILDEPQSGLDPIGRRDVSDIIKEAQKQGKTVFFSSHILPDVERLCDRVGVLKNGKMEVVGSLNDLLSNQQSVEVVVVGNPSEAWLSRMRALENVTLASRADQYTLVVKGDVSVNDILTAAISEGLRVEHVVQQRDDLEAFFMQNNKSQALNGKAESVAETASLKENASDEMAQDVAETPSEKGSDEA